MDRVDYKVQVPEGRCGEAEVRRFVVSDTDSKLNDIATALSGSKRFVPPGKYTALYVGRTLWMSDTPSEISDHASLFRRVMRSPGPRTVLLHGLGLGVALHGCILNGAGHVTVVENHPDVISLVGHYWKSIYGDRLTIIHGDALTWRPPKGQRWDVVWHDIWPEISSDNLETMVRLHRRFGRRASWQGSWCRGVCEQAKRASGLKRSW